MFSKIRKYILRNPHISFFKRNESGSEYFKVEDKYKIRLSDHQASSLSLPNTLNIMVNERDEITVMIANKPYHYEYKDLKELIKHYHILAPIFIPNAKKVAKVAKPKVVEKIVEKIVYVKVSNNEPNIEKVSTNLPIIDEKSKTIEYLGYRVNCSHLKEKNWNSLKTILTLATPKDVQAFTNTLKAYSLKKEKI